MDRFLRIATPLILLALALMVWFEPLLRNENTTSWLGETGVLRFAVGVLALYALLLVIEQQRMGVAFREVLNAFKRFGDSRGAVGEAPQREAATLLVAALASEDPAVRTRALEHLKRLTGQDFGEDKARWQGWLDQSKHSGEVS